MEDQQALAAVLPRAELFDSEFNFYLHAAGLFRAVAVTSHEVLFTQRSLSVAPSGLDTADLWLTVIKGLTDLGLYEDAYTALVAAPYVRLYVLILHFVFCAALNTMHDDSAANENVSVNLYTGCARSTQ